MKPINHGPMFHPRDIYRAQITRTVNNAVLRDLVRIDTECFEFPYTREEFADLFQRQNSQCVLVHIDEFSVGYVVYTTEAKYIQVESIAVAPCAQRLGIGFRLVDFVVAALNPKKGLISVFAEVRKTNTGAQIFFRAKEFKALYQIKDRYNFTDETAILLRYKLGQRKFPKVMRIK